MKHDSTTAGRIEKKYRWLPLVFIGLLGLFMLLLIKLFPEEKSFAVLRIQGKEGVVNFSKAYHLRQFQPGIRDKQAILAEKNDWIGVNDYYFRYNLPETDTLLLDESGDSMVLVNGKIHALIIENEETLLPFFQQMKKEDLRQLETIYFRDSIPSSYLPFLKTIAGQHPSISLVFEDWENADLPADYNNKAGYFNPQYVSLPVTNNSIKNLSIWKNAECLYLNLADSVITNPLPALPALQQCIVYSEHVSSLPAGFFLHNPQLTRVSMLTDTPFFSLVKPLEKLDELVLHFSKGEASMDELSGQLSRLSVLMISGRCTNIALLSKAKRLKWIGLPANTTQENFDDILKAVNKLQVAAISGSKHIRNYSALQQLPDLRGLIITDTVTDIAGISTLNKLRYLSLPLQDREDSAAMLSLEKALPGCIIVANSGACLGSGWLLLLFPATFLFFWLLRKNKTMHHADSTPEKS